MFKFLAHTSRIGLRGLYCYRTFESRLRHPLTSLVLSAVAATCMQSVSENALHAESLRRPNIVIIMADDLGYGDLGCYGDPHYKTPHLDRLASQGLRFTDFHANGPVCSPTRAALLTGRYQQRCGIDGVILADPTQNRGTGLAIEEVTFADVLSQAGYTTGIFGKWHLGYDVKFNPTQNGFDEFIGYVSGNVCYQSHLDRMGFADWWQNDKLVPESGYCTHLITQHAIEFISTHRAKPFCLYVAHECVHSPFQGPNDPPIREAGKEGDLKSAERKDITKAYAEMMTEMDNGIGQLMETLDELQLAEKTYVFFFSDNGATRQGSNAPWNGFKGGLLEGGHRVPCLVRKPGSITPGSTTNVTAATMDIMPTLIDLTGANVPEEFPLDGVSLVPVLHDNAKLPDRVLYWKYNNSWAVRSNEWKLLVQGGKQRDSVQLFNLHTDPGETSDVAKAQPQLVKDLTEQYHAWQADVATQDTKQF